MATKSVIKRSICLPKPLEAFVTKRARDKAKPMGKAPNFSEALAEMIVAAKTEEDLKRAA